MTEADIVIVDGEEAVTVISEGLQGPPGPQGDIADALAAIRAGVAADRDTLAKLDAVKADLDSPAFTGSPTAPTPLTSDASTRVANTAFVKAVVAALVDAAPGSLDTLKELAEALGADPAFATTVLNGLAGKQPLSANLTAFSTLAPAADQVLQFKSGAWTSRTPPQLVADLMGKTVAADAPVFDVTQTWNNASAAFTGDRVNITDTASASTSLLLDRQVGGVSKFSVGKGGAVTAAGSGTFNSNLSVAGVVFVSTDVGQIRYGASGDARLVRDAPNALAMQNGTASQSLRLYGAYTDASNYERLEFGYSTTLANTFTVGAAAAGTGTLRSVTVLGAARFAPSGASNFGVPGSRWDLHVSATQKRVTLAADTVFGWASIAAAADNGTLSSGVDLYLTRRASANLCLGQADAAAPVAQTLSVQGVAAGTADAPGQDFTIQCSASTGAGSGGGFKVQVTKAGALGAGQNAYVDAFHVDGSARLGLGPSTAFRLFQPDNSTFGYSVSGLGWTPSNIIRQGAFQVYSTGKFAWANSSNANGVMDLELCREAPYTLAQRTGANPQASRIYNSFTDTSNGEWFETAWSSNLVSLQTNSNGTGGWRSLKLACAGFLQLAPTSGVALYNGGVARIALKFSSAGLLQVRNGGDTADAIIAAASVRQAVAVKTADHAATDADRYLLVNPDGSAGLGYTVSLPSAVGRSGQALSVKHVGSTKRVTITPAGSETIDGAASPLALIDPLESVTLVSDGASWWTFL